MKLKKGKTSSEQFDHFCQRSTKTNLQNTQEIKRETKWIQVNNIYENVSKIPSYFE